MSWGIIKDEEASIDQDLKEQVDDIMDLCGLEETECFCVPLEGIGLDYTPCLARPIPDSSLRALAYEWNINHHLIIDSVFNLLPLDALSYRQFVRRQWYLVPEEGVIEEFEESIKNNKATPFLGIPLGGFRYHLLMSKDLVCRHQLPSSYLKHICYSHLQPHYAICRIGRHLSTLDKVKSYVRLRARDPREGLDELTEWAGRCASIYRHWIHSPKKPRPHGHFIGDELKSSIVEWLKNVPPGKNPGSPDQIDDE